jgi:hypothetical protein
MDSETQVLIDWGDELDKMLVEALNLIGDKGRVEIIGMIKKRYDLQAMRLMGREQFIALSAMCGLVHVLKLREQQHAPNSV